MSASVQQKRPDAELHEYLNVAEAAEFVRVSPRTLRNKMAAGVLRLGVHYFRTPGLGPRFKRVALEAWIEGRERAATPRSPLGDVPMARRALTGAARAE